MSTGIKNGKLRTNNIYVVKLIFLFIAFILVSASAAFIKNEKGWVIVIDAGHGGKDSGALGSISREKDITLAIALKTGEYIEQNIKNVTVIYTRRNDTFVELRDRANIANKNKADLFISIHANWAKLKSIHGTETFVMGDAKNQQNLEVAIKENEVILLEDDYSTKYEGFDPKSPESYIMFTLMQKVFQEQSTDLASKIQTEFREQVDRTDRDVKQAGFWVLFMTTMPSVLTETGFITNPSEEKYLNSKQGQDEIASAIFRACKDYINEIDSKSGISAVKNQNIDPNHDKLTPVISPAGNIVFMVQIATSASKTEVKPENFKGLADVIEINTQDRFRYVSGSFADYSAAVKYRKKLEVVYPDAFVIALKDNKILPLQQALEQKKKK
ncbi:MAG: N-acetylmuramoyl-L-alanine amidase [Bacteroidia bacterium]|nr:N-acetylmuramoyl-L-alanine amidase [Bacteroidia bacterium]